MLNVWPTELSDNESVLFYTTKSVTICYSSKQKPDTPSLKNAFFSQLPSHAHLIYGSLSSAAASSAASCSPTQRLSHPLLHGSFASRVISSSLTALQFVSPHRISLRLPDGGHLNIITAVSKKHLKINTSQNIPDPPPSLLPQSNLSYEHQHQCSTGGHKGPTLDFSFPLPPHPSPWVLQLHLQTIPHFPPSPLLHSSPTKITNYCNTLLIGLCFPSATGQPEKGFENKRVIICHSHPDSSSSNDFLLLLK